NRKNPPGPSALRARRRRARSNRCWRQALLMSEVRVTTRGLVAAAAALLDQGRAIDRLSRALTMAALIGLMLGPAFVGIRSPVLLVTMVLAMLAGLVQTYFAIRVGF